MGPLEVGFQGGSGQGNGARDKIVRLLKMTWLLLTEDHTVEDLAAQFGVSRRTIYRDLRMIGDAQLPLVSKAGSGGYRLVGDAAGPAGRLGPPGTPGTPGTTGATRTPGTAGPAGAARPISGLRSAQMMSATVRPAAHFSSSATRFYG